MCASYATRGGASQPDLVEAGQRGPAMNTTPLDAHELLSRVDQLLEARYRSADLGNIDDPLAEAATR
jgi:hypothetical protein